MNPTRRSFVKSAAAAAAGFACGAAPLAFADPAPAENPLDAPNQPSGRRNQPGSTLEPGRPPLRFDGGWLFGGRFREEALRPGFDDSAFTPVTLPHAVTKLSWRDWDPDSWEHEWIYRKHFHLPESIRGQRVFVEFGAAMVGAYPWINGHELPGRLGGYLPLRCELTPWLRPGENLLAVRLDSRWSPVPPEGSAKGPIRVDYLEVGGLYRSVHLDVVPQSYISDVFAKPVQVLDPARRRVQVLCTLDAAPAALSRLRLEISLRDGERVLARRENLDPLLAPAGDRPRLPTAQGRMQVPITLESLGDVELWDVDHPKLYDMVATLHADGGAVHERRARIGFREARFELGGFFLNGRRLQLFGLNRHEIYPYAGGAMPRRVHRRDAEILKREFHCNAVRCSHYPQSEAFLEACDELGLLVWEETPGWGYLGDEAWKELVVRDVREMVLRDRNHPSIVIWGVRVNESPNDPDLYRRTTAAAKELDGTRACSGSMTSGSRKNWREDWREDVFAFDDYHAKPDGSVDIAPPVPGVPYMLAEAVGQFNYTARKGFNAYYRRAGDLKDQMAQALRHAQAHSRAAADPRNCGVIAWCAFEYASLVNAYHHVKNPGVADVFRIPKLGAAFYRTQGDPRERPVIAPNFYWDFGPRSPRGPGRRAAIFSNCDRLELFVAGKRFAAATPDAAGFPHLKHPPFFVDLDLDGAGRPELRIDGYLGDTLALSQTYSSDPSQDRLVVEADDPRLIADGSDATRVVARVADKYGADRAFAGGKVRFDLSGPGELVGDNPLGLGDCGGAAAVWVRTRPNRPGRIVLKAAHSSLGTARATIDADAA